MAKLKLALTDEQVRKLGVAKVREAYKELARQYNKIVNGELLFCAACNEFHPIANYYNDKRYAIGVFPQCKKCLLEEATDYDKKTDTYTDNKEKTIAVFRKLDLPFIESSYNNAIKDLGNEFGEKNRGTAYQTLTVVVRSLPQHRGKTFADSEFEEEDEAQVEEVNENSRIFKNGQKRFGSDYRPDQLVWLETEYQDWITRYECNTKAQEEIFKNLSINRLERKQAAKDGKPTKELDKTFTELLAAQNIQPRQTGMDTFADAQTFGTLLQKYEETRPLPETDPELQDVDKIGLYFDVFFRGHASKMLGLKNAFSHIYDKFMKKYTVTRPEYSEDSDSEAVFEKVFGTNIDNE